MKTFPILTTKRLILKQLKLENSKLITAYLQDKEMSKHTTTMPFPYLEKHAIGWINNSFEKFKNNKGFVFGVFNKEDVLIGAVDFNINLEFKIANFGYWIAKPFWNNGFMTEALKEVLQFGFSKIDLREISAIHSIDNPASGKVMQKAGMKKTNKIKEIKMTDGSIRPSFHYLISKLDFKN